MSGELVIRPLQPEDRARWSPLWDGYLAFYRSALRPEITDATFARFFDSLEPMHALVAEQDDRLIGFAHFLLHRSTWAQHCYCYLEDLFVDPNVRGKGTGRALIAGVTDAARAAKASRVYWVTEDSNVQAQTLYDKVAGRPGFIQYRIKL